MALRLYCARSQILELPAIPASSPLPPFQEVRELIARCLSPNPEVRPAFAVLVTELEAILAKLPRSVMVRQEQRAAVARSRDMLMCTQFNTDRHYIARGQCPEQQTSTVQSHNRSYGWVEGLALLSVPRSRQFDEAQAPRGNFIIHRHLAMDDARLGVAMAHGYVGYCLAQSAGHRCLPAVRTRQHQQLPALSSTSE